MACALVSGELRGWEWGQERGWETRAWREGQHLAGSGRRWLSRLKAGTPLNLQRTAPTGQSCLAAQGQSEEGEFAADCRKPCTLCEFILSAWSEVGQALAELE